MTETGCSENLVVDGHIITACDRREGKGKSGFIMEAWLYRFLSFYQIWKFVDWQVRTDVSEKRVFSPNTWLSSSTEILVILYQATRHYMKVWTCAVTKVTDPSLAAVTEIANNWLSHERAIQMYGNWVTSVKILRPSFIVTFTYKM